MPAMPAAIHQDRGRRFAGTRAPLPAARGPTPVPAPRRCPRTRPTDTARPVHFLIDIDRRGFMLAADLFQRGWRRRRLVRVRGSATRSPRVSQALERLMEPQALDALLVNRRMETGEQRRTFPAVRRKVGTPPPGRASGTVRYAPATKFSSSATGAPRRPFARTANPQCQQDWRHEGCVPIEAIASGRESFSADNSRREFKTPPVTFHRCTC